MSIELDGVEVLGDDVIMLDEADGGSSSTATNEAFPSTRLSIRL